MKVYHFDGDRSESERFFNESLADYINTSGLDKPVAAVREGIRFRKGPHGKPYFESATLEGIFFSRSHSMGHEVLCFSNDEVGIDCENMEARQGIGERYMKIAERCFTEDEQEYVKSAKGDQLARFFEIWTAKEAYMKYTGNGFSEGFRTFSVLRLPDANIDTGRPESAPGVIYSVCTAMK